MAVRSAVDSDTFEGGPGGLAAAHPSTRTRPSHRPRGAAMGPVPQHASHRRPRRAQRYGVAQGVALGATFVLSARIVWG